MSKPHWTELRIISRRTQEPVTDTQERLRILRLYRQIGFVNGFVIYSGDRPARIDGVDWRSEPAFTWE